MADAWLIILTVIFSLITLAFSIFILLYYKDKDEESSITVWIGRGIVVLNVFLTSALLATLPLDVSNS